ncbi:ABC transporter permease [Cellulomonas soli]
MILVLVAATCVTTLLTVGRAAATQAQVHARLDSAGARLIVVSDSAHKGLISTAVVDVVNQLNTVQGAVAIDTPRDVVSTAQGRGGTKTPLWHVLGDPATAVTLTSGRWPRAGEGVVAEDAMTSLGLEGPIGSVENDVAQWPIVGTYRAQDSFTELDGGVLARPVVVREDPQAATVDRLYVLASSAGDVESVQSLVLSAIAPPALTDVTVQSPSTLADLQAHVGADLGSFSHTLLVLVMTAGAGLTAVVVLADVLIRRPDLGRRRALGATRYTIICLITLRTLVPAIAGAVLGTAVGALTGAGWGGLPPASFVAGTAVLASLTAVFAAVPPAIAASWADPVRVLRTP